MGLSENDNKRWIDFKTAVFSVYGINHQFERMPLEAAKAVSPGVEELYNHPAGGRIRFSTNSKTMAVRAIVAHNKGIGFDLFRVEGNREIFTGAFRRLECFICDGEFESRSINISDGTQMIPYTLNLPYTGNLYKLEIGVDEDAEVGIGVSYRNEKPIVFYGSSITQGAFASRPGSSYVSMISQQYNLHYRNLGFAGHARGEQAMADYLAETEMCAFVCDYDHNAKTPEELAQTHLPFYKTIRKAHPDIPYIMITRPDVMFGNPKENQERIEIVRKTYEYAKNVGDSNIAFIDGSTLLVGDFYHNCTRDGCHPNDLGFYRMVKEIAPVIGEMLGLGECR